MALVAIRSGTTGRARSLLEESLAISRSAGNRVFEADSMHALGVISRLNGEGSAGLSLLRHALVTRQEAGDRHGAANTLEEIAFTLTGDSTCDGETFSAAVTFAGAADALRGSTGVVKPLAERPELEVWIHRAHAVLGEGRCRTAWVRGRSMSLTQAITMVPDVG